MTTDEIIEHAIAGHASTRDAIQWALRYEREACARVADRYCVPALHTVCDTFAEVIRARGQA